MIKHFILGAAILLLAACQSYDKNYYRVHPKELNEAIAKCPKEHPVHVSCDELKTITNEVNHIAWELQSNQQEFGQQIIRLQTHLASLKTNPTQADSTANIKDIEQQLSMRLAVVKWLLSPEN